MAKVLGICLREQTLESEWRRGTLIHRITKALNLFYIVIDTSGKILKNLD